MKLLKQYWWIILLLGITIVGIQYWYFTKAERKIQLQEIELSVFKDSVNIYRAKNGALTFSLNSVQIEKANLKKALELSGFEISDLKKRNVNWRKITFALEAKLEAAGNGTIILHDSIPIPGDTVKVLAKVGKWNDGFLYLNPYLVEDKLDFTYQYVLGMHFLQSKVGKSNVVSAYLVSPNNPDIIPTNVKIVTGNSFTVIADKKAWWNHWYMYAIAGFTVGAFVIK